MVFIPSAPGSLTLNSSGSEYIGDGGSGTFIQTGGLNQVGDLGFPNGQSLVIGSSGSYSLSNAGTLIASSAESIGATGTFNQFGGTNTIGQDLQLTGTYLLSAGSLTVGEAPNTDFAEVIDGIFNQSGGTNSILNSNLSLYVGQTTGSSGTYSLSNTGSLTSSDNEYVGYSGNGTFVQSGGTNTNTAGSAWLYLGYSTGSTGIYSLSGGSVLTSAMSVGYNGTGTFNQSGGTLTASSFINVADQASDLGSYILSNGLVTTPYLAVGAGSGSGGTFIQSGGTAAATTDLYVAAGSGSTGLYSLSGTGTLTVSYGAFVGGTSSAAGGSGTLNVSGGQMTDSGTLKVWNTSGTHVTISGGTVSAANTVNLATINVTGGSANLGAVTGTGTLNVGDASASVTASGLQQSSVTITPTGQLTLTAGGATNAVNSLVIDSGGVFDLDHHEVNHQLRKRVRSDLDHRRLHQVRLQRRRMERPGHHFHDGTNARPTASPTASATPTARTARSPACPPARSK